VTREKRNVSHRWNNNDRGKPEYTKNKPVQLPLVHHKTHKDWSGTELRPPQRGRTVKLSTIYELPISSRLNNFCRWQSVVK